MILSAEGAAFIARFEGFRQQCYVCPAGKLTIGYGHVIQPGETFASLTATEALDMLMHDATREAAPVSRALKTQITSYQADALISLAFNCGGRAIARSTLLKRLNEGQFDQAALEVLRWNKGKGKGKNKGKLVVIPGLTIRRIAEKTLFLTGDYGA